MVCNPTRRCHLDFHSTHGIDLDVWILGGYRPSTKLASSASSHQVGDDRNSDLAVGYVAQVQPSWSMDAVELVILDSTVSEVSEDRLRPLGRGHQADIPGFRLERREEIRVKA